MLNGSEGDSPFWETMQNQYFRVNPIGAKRTAHHRMMGGQMHKTALCCRDGLCLVSSSAGDAASRVSTQYLGKAKPPRKGAWAKSAVSSCRRLRCVPYRAGSGTAAKDRSRTAGSF